MMIGVLGINNVWMIQYNNNCIDKDVILSRKQTLREDSIFFLQANCISDFYDTGLSAVGSFNSANVWTRKKKAMLKVLKWGPRVKENYFGCWSI